MSEKKIISKLHTATKRDYLARVNKTDKALAAEKASLWGFDYWDGSRETGYGGYHYDGRWRDVAKTLYSTYCLKDRSRVLDIGSGKGFLLHDLTEENSLIDVYGLDISAYAIENSMPSIKRKCTLGCASSLPWPDNYFDLIISINTLHNLPLRKLWRALKEISRVSRGNKFICVEAYRSEKEKVNLMYWQLTCRAFYSPDDWLFLFEKINYDGDYEFIFFE